MHESSALIEKAEKAPALPRRLERHRKIVVNVKASEAKHLLEPKHILKMFRGKCICTFLRYNKDHYTTPKPLYPF